MIVSKICAQVETTLSNDCYILNDYDGAEFLNHKKIKSGTKIIILETFNDNKDYFHVSYKGKEGYINKKFIQQNDQSKILETNLTPNIEIAKKEIIENKDSVVYHQCEAITKSGTRCSRSAKDNSKYCWQHQNYEKTNNKSGESSSYEIKVGPRGGHYYINSSGRKIYVKHN